MVSVGGTVGKGQFVQIKVKETSLPVDTETADAQRIAGRFLLKSICKIQTIIKTCYKTWFFSWKIWQLVRSPYLCTVFFIVLDLRLTKVGVQRYSFFYVRTFPE